MKRYLIDDFVSNNSLFSNHFVDADSPIMAVKKYTNGRKVKRINYFADYDIQPDFIVQEVSGTGRLIPRKQRNCYILEEV